MSNSPISFRVCDFSEQIVNPTPGNNHYTYSAVAHVDGRVYQYRKALRLDFEAPLPSLRSGAWLNLLEQIAADQSRG